MTKLDRVHISVLCMDLRETLTRLEFMKVYGDFGRGNEVSSFTFYIKCRDYWRVKNG